jgi:hypothetical protein
LVDQSWWEEGILKCGDPTFDPAAKGVKRNNNIKDDLQLQWGFGNIPPDYSDPVAGRVERNVPDDKLGDAGKMILFARDMMNRGQPLRNIVAALKKRFDKSTLVAAKDGLRAQFALDGVAGRFVVDARGYESCKTAMDSCWRSPHKRHLGYVLGCKCGTPHLISASHFAESEVKSSGNPIDDFMADKEIYVSKMIPHCRSTMLPIAAGRGDLDPEWMDKTLIDVMDLTGIPQGEVEKIQAMKSGFDKLKAAFRAIDEMKVMAEEGKYAEDVDAAKFVIDQEEQPVEVCGQMRELPDVNLVNEALQQEIEPVEPFTLVFAGPVDMVGEPEAIELSSPNIIPSLDIDLADEADPGQLDIRGPSMRVPLDVNPNPADFEPEVIDFESLDVDMVPNMEPEFEGADEFELDGISAVPDELRINMNQDMVV